MNKHKIKKLERALLGDETEPKITCVEFKIYGQSKEPEEILKTVLTKPKKTFMKILIDENGNGVKNPKMVEVI